MTICNQKTLISEAAIRFRDAIDAIGPEELFGPMPYFPHGACRDISELLAEYLTSQGLGEFLVADAERGVQGTSCPLETHAWLIQGKLIIDPTADQFPDFREKVILTSNEDCPFYRTFSVSIEGEIAAGCKGDRRLWGIYNRVMDYLANAP